MVCTGRNGVLDIREKSSTLGPDSIPGSDYRDYIMIEMKSRTPLTSPCGHTPACPPAHADDRDAALVISAHPEQGWSLLCNGVVVFDDLGELLPDGRCTGDRSASLVTACLHRRSA